MILVIGGTGFIGQALIKQLVLLGKPVRTLLRPSSNSPSLPKGLAIDVTVCALNDERGMRAAMKGVDVVYYLAGAERQGTKADLEAVDIQGTQIASRLAVHAGVKRFIYLSHLGADRASAYPVIKAKGIAEGHIIKSGVNYTIIRSAVVYGPGDQFTVPLTELIKLSPGFFIVPSNGASHIQPIWIQDLVTCLAYILEDASSVNQIFSLGGGEYLSFKEVVTSIMNVIQKKRIIVSTSSINLKILSLIIESISPKNPVSFFWLDYLAADRTCPIDFLPRQFGILPARFSKQLDYLKAYNIK